MVGMSTGTRKSGTERRGEIVRAVLRIIGERGLTALSTSSIAAEVGLTTGALFRHFDSLEGILAAAVEYALSRIDATFPDPALPPRERLLEIARNRVELFGADPGLAWLLRSEQAFLTLPPESVAKLRTVVRRSKRFLLKAIRDGIDEGSVRGDLDPKAMLVPVMGTIHALAGMPGVHRLASRPDVENTLAALMQMLAPPESASPTTRRKS